VDKIWDVPEKAEQLMVFGSLIIVRSGSKVVSIE